MISIIPHTGKDQPFVTPIEQTQKTLTVLADVTSILPHTGENQPLVPSIPNISKQLQKQLPKIASTRTLTYAEDLTIPTARSLQHITTSEGDPTNNSESSIQKEEISPTNVFSNPEIASRILDSKLQTEDLQQTILIPMDHNTAKISSSQEVTSLLEDGVLGPPPSPLDSYFCSPSNLPNFNNHFKIISKVNMAQNSSKTLRFVQINLNHCRLACNSIIQKIQADDIDFVLFQDPLLTSKSILWGIPPSWPCYYSDSKSAGIMTPNKSFHLISSFSTQNCIKINLTNNNNEVISIASCYSAPSSDLTEDLTQISNSLTGSAPIIIGGDFNARLSSLGYRTTDGRGNTMADFILQHNLVILNDPDSNTFDTISENNVRRKGNPDLTLISPSLLANISEWHVDPSPSLSDHKYVCFNLLISPLTHINLRFKTKYNNFKKLNYLFNKINNKLTHELKQVKNPLSLDRWLKDFLEQLQDICLKTFKIKKSSFTPKLTWWTKELSSARNKVKSLLKKANSSPTPSISLLTAYKKANAQYKQKIKTAKLSSWQSFCNTTNTKFGQIFKFTREKSLKPTDLIHVALDGSSPDSTYNDTYNYLLHNNCFASLTPPTAEPTYVSPSPFFPPPSCQKITIHELKYAASLQSDNKAPGYDNLDGPIIKNLIKKFPNIFLKLYNLCFELGYFPSTWKVGKFIFFTKPNKIATNPNAYRPICLLPMLGKVLERIIKLRLCHQLENSSFFLPNQFGFREARNTETLIRDLKTNILDLQKINKYCSLVSFDIEGAFDSINWNILKQVISSLPIPLAIKHILISFVTDRKILLSHKINPQHNYLYHTKGCPQGSCLGPTLWLLIANKILLHYTSTINSLIWCFADDFSILASADSRASLEKITNKHIAFFQNICTALNLTLSTDKTKGLIFGKKTFPKRPPLFKLNNKNIQIVTHHKLLGIVIDNKFNWFNHLSYLKLKTLNFICNIKRVRGATWGVSRDLLKTWYQIVTEKQIAYGAQNWIDDLNIHGRRKLSSLQRSALLPISGAYKSTSTAALNVILGIPPIQLTLKLNKSLFDFKTNKSTITHNNLPLQAKDFDFPIPSFNLPLIPHIDNLQISLIDPSSNLNHFDIIIYTDGSRMDTGTAFAFTAQQENSFILDKIFHLRKDNSIFQAELLALKEATDWALNSQFNNILIFTDNQSSIATIDQPITKNSISSDIRSNISSHPTKHITLSWIKGHSANSGNDRADSLAKSPLISPLSPPLPTYLFPFPPSLLKNILRTQLLADWKTLWHEVPEGLYTFNFYQTPDFKLKSREQFITHFLTGHGSFPTYLFRINKVDDDLCHCGMRGHPLHYIYEYCPIMPNHFQHNSSISIYKNFLVLIGIPSQIKKIAENYNELNKRYSYINYIY